jgi:hypothetical protein
VAYSRVTIVYTIFLLLYCTSKLKKTWSGCLCGATSVGARRTNFLRVFLDSHVDVECGIASEHSRTIGTTDRIQCKNKDIMT